MITVEYILKDLATGIIGRYQFEYDDEDKMLEALDFDMLLNVPEMADCVLNEFTQQERDDIASLDKDELIKFHHSVGQDIRNAFGLWLDGNPNVLIHPDDTSMEVLELMWVSVRNAGGISGSTVMEFT